GHCWAFSGWPGSARWLSIGRDLSLQRASPDRRIDSQVLTGDLAQGLDARQADGWVIVFHALKEDVEDSRVLGFQGADPFNGGDATVFQVVDRHDASQEGDVLGEPDLAEGATGLRSNDPLRVVGGLGEEITGPAVLESAQAPDDNRPDG